MADVVGSTTQLIKAVAELANPTFIVWRCVADAAGVCTGPLVKLTTTAANVMTYSDTTAAANTTYVYQVVAHSAAGDSVARSSNVVTTLVAPASAPSPVTR